jgi:pimeloyl-ACP methyl ester carboxylesterase
MSEVRALGELAATAAGGVTDAVRDTHRAFADRAFGLTGPFGTATRAMHHGISTIVYGSVRTGVATGAAAAGVLAAAGGPRGSLRATPRGRLLLGAVNGAWGDHLDAQDSTLAVEMEVCNLPGARVAATPRVALFVHGLCETEDAWRLGEERCEPYTDRLARDLGFTPLLLRYNTGLHISDNGRRLAGLLDEVLGEWPCGIEEVVLVGHSMGGLVSRSACHHASEDGMAWVGGVRHVFCLGSPFNGSDLEKAANVADWALRALPETRALGRLLNRRSVGIKDLRYGYLTEDCWAGCDPDELLRDRRCEVPWLESAQHTFIAATLSRDADHPLGRLAGDLLVRRPSAWAGGLHGEHEEFRIDASHCVGPANHFTLLNHPDVYERIREQIERSRAGERPTRAPALPAA